MSEASVSRPPAWIAPALLSVLVLADLAISSRTPGADGGGRPSVTSQNDPRALDREEQARLAKVRESLRPGAEFAGLVVTEVLDPRPDHPLVVRLSGKGLSFDITVAPAGLLPFNAPEKTRFHAIFYNGAGAETVDVVKARTALLGAIAARIRESE